MNQMRSSQKNRGARNKNGRHNKPSGNIVNRVFESAGPEGKVRGTPQQIIDKYLLLARDAQTSGDRVTAENFLQHAEHYMRILNAALPPMEERRFGYQSQPALDDGDMGEDGEGEAQELRQQPDNRGYSQPRPEGQRYEGQRYEGQRPESQRNDGQRRDAPRHESQRHESQRPDSQRFRPQADMAAAPQPELEAAPFETVSAARPEPVAQPVSQPVAEMPTPAPVAMEPAGSGLETIDTVEGDDTGPVATPEAEAEEARPKPRRRTRKPRAAAGEPAPADEVDAG